MNKNAPKQFAQTSEDTVDGGFFRFGEDTSQFTRSVNSPLEIIFIINNFVTDPIERRQI
jgi:hypothetical protein